MPDIQCLRIRIRKGKTEYVKEWISGLTSRDLSGLNEVLENEGMLIETIFIESTHEGDFLILYQRAEDLQKANDVFNASDHPVDQAVKKFIAETWDDVQPMTLLIDHEKDGNTYRHSSAD